jgi:protein gp37
MPTKIEWAEESWNPVTGCTKISEGCIHCYAERMAKRLAGRAGYPADNPFQVTLHPDKLAQPLHWRKPRRVFVCSMGDLFHDAVPYEAIDDVMRIIGRCYIENRGHTFMILTKRPQRMRHYFTKGMFMLHDRKGQSAHGGWADWDKDTPWSNLWLGVTAENQQRANERIPILLDTLAAVRFVSAEPLLEEMYLCEWFPEYDYRPTYTYYQKAYPGIGDKPIKIRDGLDWVIAGAETGPGARHMDYDWARSLRDQCDAYGVPFFFKKDSHGSHLLGGRLYEEYPHV